MTREELIRRLKAIVEAASSDESYDVGEMNDDIIGVIDDLEKEGNGE